jgi:endonuclease-3
MDSKRQHAARVLSKLKKKYKSEMRTALHHTSDWEMLVATMLSARTQDRQVNKITPRLFKKFRTINEFAVLKPEQLYPYIGSIGLYPSKAKNIVKTANMLKSTYNLKLPRTIAGLTTLPGVGRKTANVVLANAFGINEGMAIDTHCITVANRLKLVNTKDPKKIEQELMPLFENRDWGDVTHLFIALGRDTCTARVKYCERCVLKNMCPSSTAR